MCVDGDTGDDGSDYDENDYSSAAGDHDDMMLMMVIIIR